MLLLVLTVGILAGTGLGLLLSPPLPSLGSVALALLLSSGGAVVGWSYRPVRLAGIMLLAAVLSGARAQYELSELKAFSIPDDVAGVRGVVSDVPRQAGRASTFILEVKAILTSGHWEERLGRVEARTFGWTPGEGDRVELLGKLRQLVDLPGAPRATLLRRQRVSQELQVERMRLLPGRQVSGARLNLLEARSWMEDRIESYLDAPQSGLLAGLLLGSRSDIPAEVRTQFAQTGTSHIVAVSGFNVVIVSSFVLAVAPRLLGTRASSLIAILAVVAYTLVVGAPASAVRAAIMAVCALVARIVARPNDAMGGLMLAGAAMAIIDPLVLQDLGFQLSMLATAGLILFMQPIEMARTFRERLRYAVLTPLAAQVATLPLVLHTFHSLSLVALAANVVVAPLLPFAMAAGGALILFADLEYLAIPVSWLAWLAASGILESVRLFAELPGAWVATGAFPVPAMLGSYLAMLLWVVQRSPELDRFQPVRRLLRGAAPIALAVSLMSVPLSRNSDGRLSGEVLDFGEVVVASSPSGKMLVMGTKVSPQVLTTTVAERLPFWKRSIDVVILNDDSPASWRGVEALAERYTLDLLVTPPSASVSQPLAGVGRIVDASDEVRVDLGDSVTIQVSPLLTAAPNRSRLLPFALSYGLTGMSFPDREATPSPIERNGWVTVVRDRASGANVSGAAARVRWGSPNNRPDTGQGALELVPEDDGPIAFVSDGYRLTLRWNGCAGADSECTTVIGDAERQEPLTR